MMSNPITEFLKSIRARDDQQPGPTTARPVVNALPTPPPQPQPQPTPPSILPSGQAIVEGILNDLSRLTPVERAIIASALGFEESLRRVDAEDWAKLIEERVGKAYADAFRKWAKLRLGEAQ